MSRRLRIAVIIAVLGVVGAGIFALATHFLDSGGGPTPAAMNYEELTGSLFAAPPGDPFRAPKVREIPLPRFENATSIWGSLGRDPRGHIWVGVSAANSGMSAHLLEYDPALETWRDHGSVASRLTDAGFASDRAAQVKIHSRIVTGADGWLYFASSDEEGESEERRVLPRRGSHLWRIHPVLREWQHLLEAPEGLIAVSGVGRYIYALGYWDHVLYQYDTQTRQSRRVAVGAIDGHVSRNLLSDIRGHAYVPRVARRGDGSIKAVLVEFDETLRELAATPLDAYLGRSSPANSHGIVGLAYLPDGRMLFTTHVGALYLIEPGGEGKASVSALGRFHPGDDAYAPSLFQLSGASIVGGVVQRRNGFEWVVHDFGLQVARAFPVDTGALEKVLLYGSISRDNAGRAYVGGWAASEGGGQRPVLLQIAFGP
jgi:hypothetical protein